MSTGTNKERLTQNTKLLELNNTKIQKAIQKANNLPEYQDIKTIYTSTNMTQCVNPINVRYSYNDSYTALIYDKILINISYRTTKINCYYDGTLCYTNDSFKTSDNFGLVMLKIADNYCIFAQSDSEGYTSNFKSYKFNWINKTLTSLGNISFPR